MATFPVVQGAQYLTQIDAAAPNGLTAANLGAFVKFCKEFGEGDERVINFWGMVAILEGLALPFPIGFQSLTQAGRIAEIVYSYFRPPNGLLAAHSPGLANAAAVMAGCYPPAGQLPDRSATTFLALATHWTQHSRLPIVMLLPALSVVKALPNLKDKLNMRFGQFKVSQTRANDAVLIQGLGELRAHQRVKLMGGGFMGKKGKHDAGKFFLMTKAIDGHAILLISSNVNKDIDQKYIDMARGLAGLPNQEIQGTFSVDRQRNVVTLTTVPTLAPLPADVVGTTALSALGTPFTARFA